jgi:hypothetical protein
VHRIPTQKHLVEAEHHIAVFERLVADQQARVAQLRGNGDTARDALKLLKDLRMTLRLGKEQRQLILPDAKRGAHWRTGTIGLLQRTVGSTVLLECGFGHRLTPFI